jgi:AraC-like DNA-binding protein
MAVLEDLPMSSLDDKFLHSVMKIIQSNIGNENFTVQHIAEKVGFSRSQLHRKLKALTNMSANQLITEVRLKEAYKLLKYKTANVSEVAYAVGFSNMSYFTILRRDFGFEEN